MNNCKNCSSKSIASNNLNEQELELLENNSAEVRFKKGDIIFKQDSKTLNVAYLKQGLAKLHIRKQNREKILRIVKSPAYIGIPTIFGDGKNHFSATSLDDTIVCFIDATIFKSLITQNGKFAYQIILDLSKNELTDYQRYLNHDTKNVTGRIAETLLCFSDTIYYNQNFTIPLSRAEFGDLVGTSRESVSRILNNLKNDNVIKVSTSEIKILNPKLLKIISENG